MLKVKAVAVCCCWCNNCCCSCYSICSCSYCCCRSNSGRNSSSLVVVQMLLLLYFLSQKNYHSTCHRTHKFCSTLLFNPLHDVIYKTLANACAIKWQQLTRYNPPTWHISTSVHVLSQQQCILSVLKYCTCPGFQLALLNQLLCMC